MYVHIEFHSDRSTDIWDRTASNSMEPTSCTINFNDVRSIAVRSIPRACGDVCGSMSMSRDSLIACRLCSVLIACMAWFAIYTYSWRYIVDKLIACIEHVITKKQTWINRLTALSSASSTLIGSSSYSERRRNDSDAWITTTRPLPQT